jgi:hypothetical protein
MANDTKPAAQDKIRRAGRNDGGRIANRRAPRGAPTDEGPASTPASPGAGVAISRRNGAAARRNHNIGEPPPPEHCTVGLHLGDRASAFCVLDGRGNVISEGMLRTTKAAFPGAGKPESRRTEAILLRSLALAAAK